MELLLFILLMVFPAAALIALLALIMAMYCIRKYNFSDRAMVAIILTFVLSMVGFITYELFPLFVTIMDKTLKLTN